MMDNFSNSLSKNLRAMRQRLGFSQEYLATKLGLSQQAYSKIENDPSTASLKRLMQLADVLQMSLVELLECKSDYASPDDSPHLPRLFPACSTCLVNLSGQISEISENMKILRRNQKV